MPGTRAAAGPAYAGGVPDKRIDGHHERLSSETGVVVVERRDECGKEEGDRRGLLNSDAVLIIEDTAEEEEEEEEGGSFQPVKMLSLEETEEEEPRLPDVMHRVSSESHLLHASPMAIEMGTAAFSVKPFVYVIASTAAISGLLFGYDVGGSGGTFEMDTFRSYFGWPTAHDGQDEAAWVADQQGWITATATLGCIVGSLPSGIVADALGRRRAILLLAAIFSVGAALQLLALDMNMLYAGRIVAGVGMGGLSMVAPLYQSETAPAQVRGLVVCLQQLSLTFGTLLAGGINVALQSWEYGWRVSYGGQVVFSVLLLGLMACMPESPRWLIAQGRMDEARCSMRLIRHEEQVEPELREAAECVAEEDLQLRQSSWSELLSSREHMWYRTLLGVSIQFLQQATGINAIMYYYPVIARRFLTSSEAIMANLGMDVCFVLATGLAVYLADRAGRRVLLVLGALSMSVCLCVMGGLASLDIQGSRSLAFAVAACTCLYVINFAYSWGPLAWLVPAEIFPQRLRGKGMALTTAASWITTFVVARAVPLMIQPPSRGLGLSTTFFFFMACALGMAVFVMAMLPETKGVALEDMDRLFADWLEGGGRWRRRTLVERLVRMPDEDEAADDGPVGGQRPGGFSTEDSETGFNDAVTDGAPAY